MEIYKLKDDVPEKKRSRRTVKGDRVGINGGVDRCGANGGVARSGGDCGVDVDRRVDWGGKLTVTDLKMGVKNPERVNVFINGEFVLSLDVAQVVDLKVKVGRVLDESELAELKRASEVGKLYQRALEWVLMRPRSVRETRDYLYRKVYDRKLDKSYIDEIIGRLEKKKNVDDRRFAEFWVENRFVKKGVSQKRLVMELRKKGIRQEIIDEVLEGRDDEEEIKKMVAKKRARYADSEKLMAYLVRQGFSYDLVRKVVEED